MCHQKPFSVSESEDVGAIVGNSGQLQSGPCQQISAQAWEKFQQTEYYQPLYDDNINLIFALKRVKPKYTGRRFYRTWG